MHTAKVRLDGQSPYSQSAPYLVEKKPKESPDDFEARTWINRLNLDTDGETVILPAMSVKLCLADTAKFISMPVKGKARSTYTKHFESGILVLESPQIIGANGKPVTKSSCDKRDAEGKLISCLYGDRIFVPSDGVAGSGKRVWKTFPVITEGWSVEFEIVVVDDAITKDVLAKHLDAAGLSIGLGRWRVRNRGLYGRFTAKILDWQEVD